MLCQADKHLSSVWNEGRAKHALEAVEGGGRSEIDPCLLWAALEAGSVLGVALTFVMRDLAWLTASLVRFGRESRSSRQCVLCRAVRGV